MRVLFGTIIGAFILSFTGTFLVDRFLVERFSILGTFVGLERTVNAGVAFGIPIPSSFLLLLLPLILFLLFPLAWRSRHCVRDAFGYGLILGGALGNLFDRFGNGVVTDFIQIGWWPNFNVADSCITIGVVLLVLGDFWRRNKS